MAVGTSIAQTAKKPWHRPEVRSQGVQVPTNLMFCSQFCCDVDGLLECVPNAGVCSSNGGTPGTGC